ncbi:MAG: RagB/SusD family nutrient uptake outer membrane protein [Gemmatimonadota bacterium]
MMTTKQMNRRLSALVLAATVGMGACGGDLFDVKNPGKILDEDLNTAEGVKALVTGMSADFSVGYDGVSFLGARLGDEMAGSGSYFTTGRYRRGLMDSEDADGYWNDVQRARWVAEAGLQRMEAIEGFQFQGNRQTAKAFLHAGLANRWFGENFCEVLFSAPFESDDGTAQPKSAAFQRAVPELENAISHGTSAGATDIVTAAHGALASVLAWLGDWSGAMTHAAQVPTDFEWDAVYSANSGRENNQIWNETHGRFEISAYGALAGSFPEPGDPRAPYTDCSNPANNCAGANGADGQTPHYRQEKYPERGSDIPLVKGTEMRLLEAENALLQNDLATFTAKINEVRTYHGLAPLTGITMTPGASISGDPGGAGPNRTSMEAWDVLDRERHLTNWLEGRRLWDLHRWDHPFLNGGGIVYQATVDRRASCIPIADQECQTNPNVATKCFTS